MKRRYYFTELKIFCILQAFLLLVTAAFEVFLLLGTWKPGARGKVFIVIAAVCFTAATFILLWRLLQKEKRYNELCDRFSEGKIYQEFIDCIGGLFPELAPAVERLDGLLERQNIIRLSTKQAEFLALQNQINPHFLYNTLEAIRGDALCAGMENIADITEALSVFFRYTITETNNLVTIGEELDNVENYFKIQQYRFGEKLAIDIQICDEKENILKMQCPKLSLQPVIENAIFHGLERKREKGRISLMLEIVDEDLHICISDNGVGIDEKKLAELNERLNRVSVGYIVEDGDGKKGGIALKNVCRRIKLLFGEQYGLHVDSISGIGTKVTLILPVMYKRIENEERAVCVGGDNAER